FHIPALLSKTCVCLSVVQTKVLQVKQKSDFSHSGEWVVETENKDGKKEKHSNTCLRGKYFHSRDYKTPEEWRNKKVVVIGIGNSGAEIGVELSRVTKQVYLSTRRGAWILNRLGDNRIPIDFLGERRLNKIFDHALYNLKPKHRLFSQYPTLNDELPNRILSGTVQVKPNICRFQGCIKLPSVVVMLKDIQWKKAAMAQRYVTSQRHTIQVDSVSYMDEIAELVGVQPNIPRMLLTDPRLGMNVLFGPCTPYQYRLRGPGKWAGARQAILTQWERVTQPLQTRPCDELKPRRSYKWPLLLSATALSFTVYVKRNNLPAFLQDPASLLDRVKIYLPTQ
uniref:Flavin-containing monooxygenase n=1 Tax=Haplochromis burtoni TaxID=8153 RepID=A0A3Q2WZ73_HAPBU